MYLIITLNHYKKSSGDRYAIPILYAGKLKFREASNQSKIILLIHSRVKIANQVF